MENTNRNHKDIKAEAKQLKAEQAKGEITVVRNQDGTHTGLVNGKKAGTTRRIDWDSIL